MLGLQGLRAFQGFRVVGLRVKFRGSFGGFSDLML